MPSLQGNCMVDIAWLNLNDAHRVQGPVPEALAFISSLQDSYMANRLQLNLNNAVQGSFPQALAFMPSLQGISLANNNLSGTLPSSSGMFSSLLALNISHNSFTGSIPSQLGSMQGFQVGAVVNRETLYDTCAIAC